ncbi:MAG: hypothetical protein ACOX9R_09330 [Armatimonadota bacterium]|jgi:hypothetical protein
MRRDEDGREQETEKTPREEEPKPTDFLVEVTEGIERGETMYRPPVKKKVANDAT